MRRCVAVICLIAVSAFCGTAQGTEFMFSKIADTDTFLDQEGVHFDNNHAERTIRPAVIIRKNSYGNRSQQGADCQAVLMSVFRTLKQRGHEPICTITAVLIEYLATGKLPPLLTAASDG